MFELEKRLNSAIKMCNGIEEAQSKFYKIYPFLTENVSGYIKLFDFNNKSLLTVGSSADQILAAILCGCIDITIIDINPFVQYYFSLKKACILSLDYYEYIDFLYIPRSKVELYSKRDILYTKNKESVMNTLKNIDYESYLFFNELFKRFGTLEIANRLFSDDIDEPYIVKRTSLYLNSEENYNTLKKKIIDIIPTFITSDLFLKKYSRCFDNIILSNVMQYVPKEKYKILVDKYAKLLNLNGMMLFAYLYRINKNDCNIYDGSRPEVYNLDNTFKILKDYITSFETFEGTNNPKRSDSVLIYKKK